MIVALSPSGKASRHVLRRDPGAEARMLAAVGLTPTVVRLLMLVFSYGGEALPLIACAILLMARRARDPLAPWASAMMLLMVIGNGRTGAWFQNWFADPVMANYIANGSAFGMLNVVLALFSDGRFVPRWSLPVAVLGVLGSIASEPLPNSISNAILVTSMLAAVAAVVARCRRMTPGAGRQQIRWALLGFAGSMGSLALLTLMQSTLPVVDDYGAFAWILIAGYLFGSGFQILLIVAMTVALLRYRLYDADATISRSVAYGLITLGLLAVFAGSEKLFGIGGERYLGEELGAAAAAVTMAPLHHRVTRWAERRFRSGLAELRHGLPLLVADLRETAAPQALADTMLARVERGVRARHGAVVANGTLLDARDIAPAAVADWLAAHGPVDGGLSPAARRPGGLDARRGLTALRPAPATAAPP